MKSLRLLLLAIILLPLTLSGCKSSSESEPEVVKLQTSLILRDEFQQQSDSFVQGESIELLLSVTNPSNTDVKLRFSSGQQYDFYIESDSYEEVWRWSANRLFIAALTELLVPAGETVEVSEVWDQQVAADVYLDIGSYKVYGSFLEQSPEAEFAFTIQ